VAQSSARPIAQARPFQPEAGDASIGPIDRKYLARFTLGNLALEQEVLELFAGQAPHYLADLRAASTAKAWRNAAHTIKGSAAAVGALRVSRFAELAERVDFDAAMASAETGREQAIAALEAAVEEASRHIARLFPAA
jgi:HPt (histidine-containing phosphotransfer) domain-containing protein